MDGNFLCGGALLGVFEGVSVLVFPVDAAVGGAALGEDVVVAVWGRGRRAGGVNRGVLWRIRGRRGPIR